METTSTTGGALRIRRMLVPLDGSALAERALPLAVSVARATQASVTLARVIQASAWGGPRLGDLIAPQVITEMLEDEAREARRYLDGVANRLRTRQIAAVSTIILYGEPGAALLEAERTAQADLVVMATHGRTGLGRATMGSVADHMLRKGQAPVLLARAAGERQEEVSLAHALIPLDGSALAEEALTAIPALAGALIGRLTLAQVVNLEALAGEAEEAQCYLSEVRGRLTRSLRGAVAEIATVVLYGEAPEQIVSRAARGGCDVIVMATHGRGGLSRVAFGSTADAVLRAAEMPILLMRARRE
jgi:nucleotide-binding universal stress UspA family protein